MTRILIIDDEEPLLRNLTGFLGSLEPVVEVRTATTGEAGLECLGEERFDVLLTDVRLPGIDGIELLPRALELQPHLKVVVMTAFATPEIRDLALHHGAIRFLDKPLDLKDLRRLLDGICDVDHGWSGTVGDLELFDLIQLMVFTQRTRALRVILQDRQGVLVFQKGTLVHASCPNKTGEEAFFEIAGWQGGRFEELSATEAADYGANIDVSAVHLMMEAARLWDEAAREVDGSVVDPRAASSRSTGAPRSFDSLDCIDKEVLHMAIKEHLERFATVEGFRGVGVFTAQGDMVESFTQGSDLDINSVGMYANNALLNTQKATDQMGVGRGNLVQIRAPKASVIMRCLNEATDFAATRSGRAHFHTVVVMDPEGNAAMAGMILDSIVDAIAEELR